MWPSERPCCKLGEGSKKSVLLFNSIPSFLVFHSIEDLLCKMPEVCVCWDQLIKLGISPDIAFSKDEDVIPLAEGISKVGNWFENNFRILSRCLVSRRAIVVPIW